MDYIRFLGTIGVKVRRSKVMTGKMICETEASKIRYFRRTRSKADL